MALALSLLGLLALAASPATHAAGSALTTQAADDKARVLMLGTFHFDNPGLDAVKHEVVDVMTAPSQAYLEALADRLAAFRPTVVLLEYSPDNEDRMNARYRDYLAGRYTLERNEIYQLGFRVARRAGLDSVASFDERNTPSDGELWNYMPQHAPQAMEEFTRLIEELSAEGQRHHTTLDLRALMQQHNAPEHDRRNKDLYLKFNAVGAKDKSFHGADSAASWWRRNFRMYANIQLHATPGARILVIGGQGHAAILRDFIAIDGSVDEEPVAPYL